MTTLWDTILPPCIPGPSSLACPVRSTSSRDELFVVDDTVLRRAAGIRHVKESLWDDNEEQDEKRGELIKGNWMRLCGVYMGWKTAEVRLQQPFSFPFFLVTFFFLFFLGGRWLMKIWELSDDHFHQIHAEYHRENG